MNKYVKYTVSLAAIGVYLLALRYVAPSDKPYFLLGIGIVSLVSWMLGTVQGLSTAMLLIPLTNLVYQQFSVSTSYLAFASSPPYLILQIMAAFSFGYFRRERKALAEKKEKLEDSNYELFASLSRVQELGGRHNLCSSCKAIQDDEGEWQTVDHYLKEQTKMEISHCMCPDCAEQFMQEAAEAKKSA